MLIRKTQIQHFQQVANDKFTSEITADIRLHLAAETKDISDEELSQKVETGIKRARGYGLIGKYPIAMFVELMFMIGPDFDMYPPAKFILEDAQILPDARFDRLLEAMNEQHWENAKRRSNPLAW